MKLVKKIQVGIVAMALACVAILCALASTTNAYAWSTDDWRPSAVVLRDIETWKAQIPETEKTLEHLKGIVSDYENNTEEFTKNIETNLARYNYLHDYITDNQKTLENLTKISYASYFAKTLLEDVVGNKLAADALFKWGFVNWLFSLEDATIEQLISDYYQAKDDVDESKTAEQKAKETYANAKNDITTCENNIKAMKEGISYWESKLPGIYEIESEYGVAGDSFITGDGYFNWPLQNLNVTSHFGEEREIESEDSEETSGVYFHKGTDFNASVGDPVYAAADGLVVESGETPNMGIYIKIEHEDGFVTIYMHLSQAFVPSGVRVHRGDNIALAGNTGDSTGPHLHFQVNKDGVAVDGLDYL